MPDFQQNGDDITVSKYCQILRGYRSGKNDVPVLIKMVGGEIDPYLTGPERVSTLDALCHQMGRYHRILGDNGVNVSDNHTVHRTRDSVLEVTIDGGPNIHTLLKECTRSEAAGYIKEILKSTLPILENPDIGIDLHPGNFVIYRDNMRFIDFLPARYRTRDDVPLVGIPQPSPRDPMLDYLYQRYYQPERIMRRLWFTLSLFEQDYEKLFFRALAKVLTKKQYDLITSFINELPFNRMRELKKKGRTQEILNIIDEFGYQDIDDIRESSTLFCKPITRSWIFRLTGIDLFKPEADRAQGIIDAKAIIMKAVEDTMA